MFSEYLNLLKKNIHVVIAMSPLGDIFRNRLRMFPSLVSCCTIDYFSEWPEEALLSVAEGFMEEADLKLDEYLPSAIKTFCNIHQSVEVLSKQYLEELNRHNYVTPTSYLVQLKMFQMLLENQRILVGTKKNRLKVGLDKLKNAGDQVADLQQMLIDKQPELTKTLQEVDEMSIVIKKDTEIANETSRIVAVQEADAMEKAAEAKEIKDSAQGDLDKALPALDAALKSLDLLEPSHIIEVKNLGDPPMGVKLTAEAVCIMKQIKPIKVPGPTPGTKIDD